VWWSHSGFPTLVDAHLPLCCFFQSLVLVLKRVHIVAGLSNHCITTRFTEEIIGLYA
jgi:hypothetical protein